MQQNMNVSLLRSAIEFKMDIRDPTRMLPQAFGDMVRVSNNLLIDSLKSGKVVDSVTIYGLLYDKQFAIPIKYFSNFIDDIYEIKVGRKDSFSKVFGWVVFLGLLGS